VMGYPITGSVGNGEAAQRKTTAFVTFQLTRRLLRILGGDVSQKDIHKCHL